MGFLIDSTGQNIALVALKVRPRKVYLAHCDSAVKKNACELKKVPKKLLNLTAMLSECKEVSHDPPFRCMAATLVWKALVISNVPLKVVVRVLLLSLCYALSSF